MGDLKEFVASASGKLGIPQEILTGLPVIELTGDTAVMIEQHKGLSAYSEEEVAINVNIGTVRVLGQRLTIQLMNHGRIILYGKIESVQVERSIR